jgi:serine/threonine protein kinase
MEGEPFNISCPYFIPVHNHDWVINPQLVTTLDGSEGHCIGSPTTYFCHVNHAQYEHSGTFNVILYDISSGYTEKHSCIWSITVLLSDDEVDASSTIDSTMSSPLNEDSSEIVLIKPTTKSSIIKTSFTTTSEMVVSSSQALPTTPNAGDSSTVGIIVAVVLIGLLLSFMLVLLPIISFMIFRYRAKKTRASESEDDSDVGFLLGESFYKGIIPFDSIVCHGLVYKGRFTSMHFANIKNLKSFYFVKQLNAKDSEMGKEELTYEIELLKKLKTIGTHPNILKYVGTTIDPDPPCLVTEFVPNGALQQFLYLLRNGPTPNWYIHYLKENSEREYNDKQISKDIFHILLQVIKGCQYLAENDIIHGHLSTGSIMIGRELSAKICHFTVNQNGNYFHESGRESFVQDLAPEVISDGMHSIKSEIWSFGIMLYRTATFEFFKPFKVSKPDLLLNELLEGATPSPLPCFSEELYYQMQQCWKLSKEDRQDFSQLLQELEILAPNSHTHIIFEISDKKKGYVSDKNQIYLSPLTSITKTSPTKKESETEASSNLNDDKKDKKTSIKKSKENETDTSPSKLPEADDKSKETIEQFEREVLVEVLKSDSANKSNPLPQENQTEDNL